MAWRKTAASVGFLILAVAPSAWTAWHWRSMPQLGFHHDDSLYWVSAKSLAIGSGYRILSLPNQPFQTKYPPLFPALLSLAWKINPTFPANLPVAVLLVWCAFPFYVALIFRLLGTYGFSPPSRYILTALSALNPLAILYSFSLMTELLFTTLLLTVVILAPSSTKTSIAFVAGLLTAAAYLTRSAALPLVLVIPACYLLRRQFRCALAFLVAAVPGIVAWQLWVARHVVHSSDLVTLYYTDYLGYQKYNVGPADLPVVIWRNFDAYLIGIGKLITFDVAFLESVHLERVVAVAALAGVVRMTRRTRSWEYPLFGLVYSLLLMAWHFPPDERFVFPLYPLLLAGLWTELHNLFLALISSWRKNLPAERIVAAAFGTLVVLVIAYASAANLYGLYHTIPDLMISHRDDSSRRLPAYRWLAANAGKQSAVFAYNDPLVYLYTGRTSCRLPVPTKLLYHDDQSAIDNMVQHIPDFAQAHGLDAVMVGPSDFYADLQRDRASRLLRTLEADHRYRQTYWSDSYSVFVHY